MRNYEVAVIVDPDVDDRQVPTLIDTHLKVISDGGGTVDNIDLAGRRRLSYRIKNTSENAYKVEGVYVFVTLSAEPDTVNELHRRLTLDDKILRNKVFRPDGGGK